MFSNIAETFIKNFDTGSVTLVYLITFHGFSFCLISFLIITSTRKMLKYMTRADLIGIHFYMILI